MSPKDERVGRVSIREVLRCGIRRLTAAQSDTPRLDAEMLLAHLLEMRRENLYTQERQALSREQARSFSDLIERRLAGEPVAYLIGRRAFYDTILHIDNRVLIPRPETELLVEEAIRWWRTERPTGQIVDVGTGSGAIAIALARELKGASLIATDISPAALQVAAENISRHHLGSRVQLVCCDLLAAFQGPFALIIANLPYIPTAKMANLPNSVRKYEPALALDGGLKGVVLILRLLKQSSTRLAQKSLILLEIDDHQAESVISIAHNTLRGRFAVESTALCDYAEHRRMIRIGASATY